jgi:acylphosphatase
VTEETLACQLTVHGHVQGVFFRDSVRREATRRGVAGWAANRPDGSVEVVLEGPPEQVKQVIDYCHRGPRGAAVTDVEVSTIEPQGLSGFQIR